MPHENVRHTENARRRADIARRGAFFPIFQRRGEQPRSLREQDVVVDTGVKQRLHLVVAAHAPIVSYTGAVTDNAAELYDILAEYPNAVTVGGHTHTLENHIAGDKRAEWAEAGIP